MILILNSLYFLFFCSLPDLALFRAAFRSTTPTDFLPSLAALRAAWLTMFEMSAPEKPIMFKASFFTSIVSVVTILSRYNFKISIRPKFEKKCKKHCVLKVQFVMVAGLYFHYGFQFNQLRRKSCVLFTHEIYLFYLRK